MRKGKLLAGLMALVLGISSLAGCGDGNSSEVQEQTDQKEWADMIYPEYHSLYADMEIPADHVNYHTLFLKEGETLDPEATDYYDYWAEKPVAYQFVSYPADDHNNGLANYFAYVMNLYEDGSIKGWLGTFLIPSMFDYLAGETPEEDEFNSKTKVVELYYGYWEEADGELTIYVQNSFDYSADGDMIQYKKYTVSTEPVAYTDSLTNVIQFFFNITEKGQSLNTSVVCNLDYENTVQYSSYAYLASGSLSSSNRTAPDGTLKQ
ncbi:MAG: hypothetical protein IJ773_13805 [Lachnospiraceae bacterium]|nr:hypothetical protein [Lachnospiraceae bacterium]